MPIKLVQPENAYVPILVTLSGIAMPVKLVQPENAYAPIFSIPSVSVIVGLLFRDMYQGVSP